MKNLLLILIGISLIFTIIGFYICTISTETVFIGIGIIIVGAIGYLIAAILAVKLIKNSS